MLSFETEKLIMTKGAQTINLILVKPKDICLCDGHVITLSTIRWSFLVVLPYIIFIANKILIRKVCDALFQTRQ
jgi:hypothetical protein